MEENADGTREYSTIVYEFPPRKIFQGLESEQRINGEPFRNNTDVMKQYVFKHVKQFNVVVIGLSSDSQFDFGISVSSLSASTWESLTLIT